MPIKRVKFVTKYRSRDKGIETRQTNNNFQLYNIDIRHWKRDNRQYSPIKRQGAWNIKMILMIYT